MIQRYFGGRVPEPSSVQGADEELKREAKGLVDTYAPLMSELGFHKALIAIWGFVGKVNRYIVTTEPWVLAIGDRERLSTVMAHIWESIRVISVLLWPFMPGTAEKIHGLLGLPDTGKALRMEHARAWGGERPARPISQIPHLFPRVEKGEKEKSSMEQKEMNEQNQGEKISFKEFQRLDLRIGTIKSAEAVPKSKRLLKLVVDIGEERTVVAGIAGKYPESALVGKQVVLVANLEPAVLMGVESQGMVLAAEDETGVHLLAPDVLTTPGSKVR